MEIQKIKDQIIELEKELKEFQETKTNLIGTLNKIGASIIERKGAIKVLQKLLATEEK